MLKDVLELIYSLAPAGVPLTTGVQAPVAGHGHGSSFA